MMYIALFLGLVVGWWLSARHIEHWLILFYHRHFYGGELYLALYDVFDDKFVFQRLVGCKGSPKTYAEFLSWHQAYRPRIAEVFRESWGVLVRVLSRRYILLVIVPALLFVSRWHYFLAGVILMHTVYFFNRRFARREDANFYALIMFMTVFEEARED